MNNYIIDPSVFYWINVLSILQTVFGVIGGITFAGGIILTVTYIFASYNAKKKPNPPQENASSYDIREYDRDLEEYNEDRRKLHDIRKWMIPLLIIGNIMIIAAIFIPGKTTSVEMLVAKTATFDNVNWTVQQVKEIIDYITSSLRGVV